MDSDLTGIYHCTAEGMTSWHGVALAVFDELGMTVQVRPCKTDAFPRPARRPANSVLENAGLKTAGLNRMRDWRVALHDFLHQQKEALLACDAT
jgi:dTDP-4-dehydrorhamnose reductase